LTEFTGERVVPGEVEADLWNEHFGRYAFAARLSRMKRVLDAGCGMGYGSAELARVAASVVGVDISGDAVASARERYVLPRVTFLQGSCASLPFRAASFDLVVAFEVIEHLKEWREFLAEARRVLAPGGQCLISTPNRDYYTDSRGRSGPNPYHHHEFSFEEFRQELLAVFPHVALFLQNHVDGFVFQPAGQLTPAEARLDQDAGNPTESNFFLAVCALSPQTGSPSFLYVPRAANVLREREQHIEKLGQQIAEINQDRTQLLDLFRKQTEELKRQANGYETKVSELEDENRKNAEWAVEIERRLTQELVSRSKELESKCQELAECVRVLHETEKTVEERTNWALQLDEQIRQLNASLHLLRESRWVKLGNALGMSPRLRDG
jgi:ubiquinone/menaquinone biosynthesis C-methylase UbiE